MRARRDLADRIACHGLLGLGAEGVAGQKQPLAGSGGPEVPSEATEPRAEVRGAQWRLWFPARLGPARKRKVRLPGGGHGMERYRVPELPPTKNTRDSNVHVHNGWVQEWREAARLHAMAMMIPPCERIRISAVIYRDRLGIADAENDHARLAPLQDGLVDAGVVPKDTYRYVERGSVREMRSVRGFGPGIELIVEELDR